MDCDPLARLGGPRRDGMGAASESRRTISALRRCNGLYPRLTCDESMGTGDVAPSRLPFPFSAGFFFEEAQFGLLESSSSFCDGREDTADVLAEENTGKKKVLVRRKYW
jgi:hypothetical protein